MLDLFHTVAAFLWFMILFVYCWHLCVTVCREPKVKVFFFFKQGVKERKVHLTLHEKTQFPLKVVAFVHKIS